MSRVSGGGLFFRHRLFYILITSPNTSTNRSRSARVVSRPSVKRRDELAHSGLPSAETTYDDEFSASVRHDDEYEHAIPAISSEMTVNSASIPCHDLSAVCFPKQMFILFGKRSVAEPFSVAWGNFCKIFSIASSRNSVSRTDSLSRISVASSSAHASPTMPGTFSVPLRRPRSCPPPCTTGASRTPSRTYSKPIPRGPYILIPSKVIISTPSFNTCNGRYSPAWHASV